MVKKETTPQADKTKEQVAEPAKDPPKGKTETPPPSPKQTKHYTPPPENMKARLLLLQGASDEQASQQSGVAVGTVKKIRVFLNGDPGKSWTAKHYPDLARKQTPAQKVFTPQAVQPSVTVNVPQYMVENNPPAPLGNGDTAYQRTQVLANNGDDDEVSVDDDLNGQQGGAHEIQREQITIDSGPAGKRSNVQLTPRTLLWYDYWRKKGFAGDMSEFIDDSINAYSNKRGVRFAIINDV